MALKVLKQTPLHLVFVDTGMTHAMFEEGSADVMEKQILYLWSLWSTRGNCTIVTLLASDDSDFIHGSIIQSMVVG